MTQGWRKKKRGRKVDRERETQVRRKTEKERKRKGKEKERKERKKEGKERRKGRKRKKKGRGRWLAVAGQASPAAPAAGGGQRPRAGCHGAAQTQAKEGCKSSSYGNFGVLEMGLRRATE